MVFHWRLIVCFEYFDRTFYRFVWNGRFVGIGGGPLRVARLLDPADSWLGVRAVLLAVERVHHAGIFGTEVQPQLRRVFGGDFDHRLYLHKDFRSALCGERCS